jgi:hypothetical protein
MEQSGRGTITLFSAALEDRIKVAVVSCYFCTFKDSIMTIYHCDRNYVLGLLAVCEMSDIAGLIAPRSRYIIAGKEDQIFPITGVMEAYERLKQIYNVAGAEDKLELYVGSNGHRYYMAAIL